LSAYNLLVHNGQILVIDLPQVVDIVANPGGAEFLGRNVRNIADWFHGKGLDEHVADADTLIRDLRAAAGLI
jgi:RIO kinase 1